MTSTPTPSLIVDEVGADCSLDPTASTDTSAVLDSTRVSNENELPEDAVALLALSRQELPSASPSSTLPASPSSHSPNASATPSSPQQAHLPNRHSPFPRMVGAGGVFLDSTPPLEHSATSMPDDLVPTFTPTPTPTAHSSSTTPKLALSKAESPLHPLSTASGERSHDHSSASTAPLAFSVDNLVGNSATSSPPLSSSPHSQSPRLAKALPLATSPTAFDEGKLSRTHLQPHNASIPHYRAASPPDSVVPAVPRSVAAASSGKAACVLPPSAAAAGELAVRPKVAAGTATDSPTTSDDRAVGIETFYGYIGSAMDAVVVVEACRLGILHSLDMRPREVSEISTRSGSVIVFDEAGSRMRRWRDNRKWSPSRVSGPFLLYKEIGETPIQKKPSPPTPVECIPGLDPVFGVGVLRGNCSILDDGLIKKTISVVMDDGRRFRVISYYLRSDVVEGRLSLPTKSPILASIDPSSERLLKLLPSETRSPKGSANGSGAASQRSSTGSSLLGLSSAPGDKSLPSSAGRIPFSGSTGGVKRKPLSQPPTAVATKRSRADSPPSPHTPSDSGVSMPAGGNGKVNPEAGRYKSIFASTPRTVKTNAPLSTPQSTPTPSPYQLHRSPSTAVAFTRAVPRIASAALPANLARRTSSADLATRRWLWPSNVGCLCAASAADGLSGSHSISLCSTSPWTLRASSTPVNRPRTAAPQVCRWKSVRIVGCTPYAPGSMGIPQQWLNCFRRTCRGGCCRSTKIVRACAVRIDSDETPLHGSSGEKFVRFLSEDSKVERRERIMFFSNVRDRALAARARRSGSSLFTPFFCCQVSRPPVRTCLDSEIQLPDTPHPVTAWLSFRSSPNFFE